MKPSERIGQIMVEKDIVGGLWTHYIPAIIAYLDEQHKEEGGK